MPCVLGLIRSIFEHEFEPAMALGFGSCLLGIFISKQITSPTPMLDIALLKKPAILAGMVLAVVVTAALAGVELTLAQELQYVIGKTPLEAGLFMLPIMIASGLGGPLAGGLSGLWGFAALQPSPFYVRQPRFSG